MPTINWNESSPAGADSVGLGAGEFRSLKTALRTALDGEHVFPSAGGDAGAHRLGSGRPYYGPQSAVSSTGSDGRLMQASDTSRLFGCGSGGTSLIGGPTVMLAAAFPGSAPQRHYWACEFGQGKVTNSTWTTVTFSSAFSGIPYTVVTPDCSSAAVSMAYVNARTATSVDIGVNDFLGNFSNISFDWISIGTRTL